MHSESNPCEEQSYAAASQASFGTSRSWKPGALSFLPLSPLRENTISPTLGLLTSSLQNGGNLSLGLATEP